MATKKYRDANKGVIAEKAKLNHEKIKAYQKEYRKANLIKLKEYQYDNRFRITQRAKEKQLLEIKNLSDNYIKSKLRRTGFKNEQITPELIELKRITLKTTRLCRQLKN